ncbi:MAG: plastocyanin/azurin family copper-binding protein [Parcubacteria group bacterium]|jgi:nitrite reductase (NO-forming)
MEEETKKENESAPKKRNLSVWIAAALIIIIIGIFYVTRGRSMYTAPPAQTPAAKTPNELSASDIQNMRVFEISGKPFEFSVKEIKVKKGDKVRINFSSTQGMHDWVVDEFNAKTKIVQAGQSDSIEFVADKTGIFEYYCSVPTHRQQGMVGKLIVE